MHRSSRAAIAVFGALVLIAFGMQAEMSLRNSGQVEDSWKTTAELPNTRGGQVATPLKTTPADGSMRNKSLALPPRVPADVASQILSKMQESSISTDLHADRVGGVGWGHAVDGLRAKVLTPVGRIKSGEEVPVVVSIQNQGSSRSADGSAVLGPVLRVNVVRNGWGKALLVPVHSLNPRAYLTLEKGKEFHYAMNLARFVDLDVPGKYLVVGGYDSTAATEFKDAWRGREITSPPYTWVNIVPRDARAANVSKERKPRISHRVCETEWGEAVRGLRCKLAVHCGTYSVGETVAATLTIENLGTPDSMTGTAQLYPHVDVWIRRAGWKKYLRINLDIENRVWIKKGKTFSHSLNLSKEVDMIVPGEYAFCAGHWAFHGTDIGDWHGLVKSPLIRGVVIGDE